MNECYLIIKICSPTTDTYYKFSILCLTDRDIIDGYYQFNLRLKITVLTLYYCCPFLSESGCRAEEEPTAVDESGFNRMNLNDRVERDTDYFKQPKRFSELEKGNVTEFILYRFYMFYIFNLYNLFCYVFTQLGQFCG